MNSSIVQTFIDGTATADQWAGLFILAALGVGAFVALIRQHIRDTKEDARKLRGGRVRF